MTDRELLEMAAKAAGEITPSWYGNANYFDGVLKRWNPLTDDGDALRLAVRLRITVDYRGCANSSPSYVSAIYKTKRNRMVRSSVYEHYVPEEMFAAEQSEIKSGARTFADDELSHARYLMREEGFVRGINYSVRRAIVRAAAEIGKGIAQKPVSDDLPEDNYYKTQAEAEQTSGKETP